MPPLASVFPTLPWTGIDIIMNIVAGLGAIMLTYAVFLEAEKSQDALFSVGAACLLIYALWIGNKIFSVAMAGVLIASFIELIEILTGRHEHTEAMVEKYRHPQGQKKNPEELQNPKI